MTSAPKERCDRWFCRVLLAILVPIVVGLVPFLGAKSVGGLLIGAIATGVMLAITMANAGGAWDNAKKYIEAGQHGGKGSEPHKAAVVGRYGWRPIQGHGGAIAEHPHQANVHRGAHLLLLLCHLAAPLQPGAATPGLLEWGLLWF